MDLSIGGNIRSRGQNLIVTPISHRNQLEAVGRNCYRSIVRNIIGTSSKGNIHLEAKEVALQNAQRRLSHHAHRKQDQIIMHGSSFRHKPLGIGTLIPLYVLNSRDFYTLRDAIHRAIEPLYPQRPLVYSYSPLSRLQSIVRHAYSRCRKKQIITTHIGSPYSLCTKLESAVLIIAIQLFQPLGIDLFSGTGSEPQCLHVPGGQLRCRQLCHISCVLFSIDSTLILNCQM